VQVAFKEWSVVVDALGRGDQAIILRKGGLHEGRGGFRPEHGEFLLFPTRFHQQRDAVVPAAQARYDELARDFPPEDRVRIEFFAGVAAVRRVTSLAAALALQGRHVWRDEVIAERFAWGREESVWALVVRVFRLPAAVELPLRPEHGGCRSWITLAEDVPTAGARAVLADEVFAARLRELEALLPAEPPA
jgi:hypothetical protein